MVGPGFTGGSLLRKRLAPAPILSCWQWYLASSTELQFRYGAHTHFDEPEDFLQPPSHYTANPTSNGTMPMQMVRGAPTKPLFRCYTLRPPTLRAVLPRRCVPRAWQLSLGGWRAAGGAGRSPAHSTGSHPRAGPSAAA